MRVLIPSILILTVIIGHSCSSDKKGNGALKNNKGKDDFGARYSIQCESNVCDSARNRPGIELLFYDRFNFDSIKSFPLQKPDTTILCCGNVPIFLDSLESFKSKCDSMRKKLIPFGGSKSININELAIEMGLLKIPNKDSIIVMGISSIRNSPILHGLLVFRDTNRLNLFTKKLDSLARTCCYQ
jgi:hypothetical protein